MIKIDKEVCIGCGSCESLCPRVFVMKDMKAVIKKGQESSKEACVKEAIEICPVDAIVA